MRGRTAALPGRTASSGLVSATTVGLVSLGVLALAYVIYAMWPRWPEAPHEAEAPTLPIVIGEILFQVPTIAIRQRVQRRAGVQERVDLAFLWPSLVPSALTREQTRVPAIAAAPRLFVGIAGAPAASTPEEKLRTIYPRYLETNASPGPAGLTIVAFREDGAYRGEDLYYDRQAPDRFIARCTRDKGPMPGNCLYERLIGGAKMTVRFPRAWIDDWRGVLTAIDTIVSRLQPASR